MSLRAYFEGLIEKVESSEEIQNDGKDANGFYKPTRSIVLKHLNLLRDLHDKPRAREMVKSSWSLIVEHLPPEWLALSPTDKADLKKILE
ncbi:MAG: hypothetical protein KF681_03410 [Bdellovibrionaceae bacterium]|nr:hypothetical protein [Pseudobdellovibrionaceae bacterium]